jgi:hypothetical protein
MQATLDKYLCMPHAVLLIAEHVLGMRTSKEGSTCHTKECISVSLNISKNVCEYLVTLCAYRPGHPKDKVQLIAK